MKKNFAISALALGMAAVAAAQSPAPTKIGIVNLAYAIQATNDGKEAADRLNKKFSPMKADLDKRQAEIQSKTDQQRKGAATMSQEALANLNSEIQRLTTAFNRDQEDAQADLDQEQGKVMNELGTKMMEILRKYGADNGFAVILDISDPQTSSVRYADPAVDVTDQMIKLYDAKYPAAAAKPAAPAAAPAAPAARPPAAPTKKP